MSKHFDYKRETSQDLLFYITGQHDDRQIRFTAKSSRSLSNTTYLIDLANTLAGGGATQIEASYDSTNDVTTVTVHLLPSVTNAITDSLIYWDLISTNDSDSSDVDIPETGTITISPNYRVSGGSVAAAASIRVVFKIVPPSTITQHVTAVGFSGTLSGAIAGNNLIITSTVAEFSNLFVVGDNSSLIPANFGPVSGSATKFIVTLPAHWSGQDAVYIEIKKVA